MPLRHELLIDLLREVNQGMGKYVKDILVMHDIPFTTMIISRQIAGEPGITISELSRRTNIAKSHISNIIRELDTRGWVEKRADAKDQRILRLYLTETAVKHLQQVRMDIREQMNKVVSDVPEQRVEELIAGLGEIKLVLEKERSKEGYE